MWTSQPDRMDVGCGKELFILLVNVEEKMEVMDPEYDERVFGRADEAFKPLDLRMKPLLSHLMVNTFVMIVTILCA